MSYGPKCQNERIPNEEELGLVDYHTSNVPILSYRPFYIFAKKNYFSKS